MRASVKEGQTIKINLKSSFIGDEHGKKSHKSSNETFTSGILPPPPGSNIPKPPPASTSTTPSDSNWIKF